MNSTHKITLYEEFSWNSDTFFTLFFQKKVKRFTYFLSFVKVWGGGETPFFSRKIHREMSVSGKWHCAAHITHIQTCQEHNLTHVWSLFSHFLVIFWRICEIFHVFSPPILASLFWKKRWKSDEKFEKSRNKFWKSDKIPSRLGKKIYLDHLRLLRDFYSLFSII